MASSVERIGPRAEPAPAPATCDLLHSVFRRLDDAGVRWALLRGRSTLGMPGGDVDLLVSADDLDSFEDVVFELGAFVLPRVRVPGSWSRAVLRHPWHRFYILSDPSSGASVKLDVVSRLVYNKRLQLESGLERGCLERRVEDGGVRVLDPTDAFWTVLMHCLLDKRKVSPHRAAELESACTSVRRPSPGEELFESLCPPGCSADQALAAVLDRDWQALADLGDRVVRSAGGSTPGAADAGVSGTATPKPRADGPSTSARGTGVTPGLDRAVRAVAVSAYPVVWRRSGLGVVPRILDVLEEASVDATVLRLRRRPAVCDVLVLMSQEQQASVRALLRARHYVPAAGRWHRLTGVGLETVRVVTPDDLGLSAGSLERIREASVPMAGRTHCRRARGSGPLLHGVPDEGGEHARPC